MMILDFVLVIFFTASCLLFGYHILRMADTKNKIRDSIFGIVIVLMLATGTFWSISNYRGYPSYDIHMAKYQLLWGVVKQPQGDDPGAIYLWLYEPDRTTNWLEEQFGIEFHKHPRAYKMTYSEEAERELAKALQQIKQGGAANVELERQQIPNSGNDQKNHIKFTFQILTPQETLPKK